MCIRDRFYVLPSMFKGTTRYRVISTKKSASYAAWNAMIERSGLKRDLKLAWLRHEVTSTAITTTQPASWVHITPWVTSQFLFAMTVRLVVFCNKCDRGKYRIGISQKSLWSDTQRFELYKTHLTPGGFVLLGFVLLRMGMVEQLPRQAW